VLEMWNSFGTPATAVPTNATLALSRTTIHRVVPNITDLRDPLNERASDIVPSDSILVREERTPEAHP
jgi:hypothetical protein